MRTSDEALTAILDCMPASMCDQETKDMVFDFMGAMRGEGDRIAALLKVVCARTNAAAQAQQFVPLLAAVLSMLLKPDGALRRLTEHAASVHSLTAIHTKTASVGVSAGSNGMEDAYGQMSGPSAEC